MAEAEETTAFFSRLIIIGLLASLVCIGGFAVYLFYGINDTGEPAILYADADPYKVRPADPGGKKLDNLDSPMMAILGGDKTENTETELLLPPEEEPELPPISVETPVAEAAEPEKAPAEETAVETQENTAGDGEVTVAETPQESSEETQVAKPAVTVTETVEPETETADPQQEAAETVEPESQPQAAEENTTATAETAAPVENIDDAVEQVIKPVPKPKIKPVLPTGDNTFIVQFAAFRSEKSARETAALLSTKHAARLDGMVLGYMRKGEYWRVVSDPLPRSDAASMCRIFVSVGQDCIVKSLD